MRGAIRTSCGRYCTLNAQASRISESTHTSQAMHPIKDTSQVNSTIARFPMNPTDKPPQPVVLPNWLVKLGEDLGVDPSLGQRSLESLVSPKTPTEAKSPDSLLGSPPSPLSPLVGMKLSQPPRSSVKAPPTHGSTANCTATEAVLAFASATGLNLDGFDSTTLCTLDCFLEMAKVNGESHQWVLKELQLFLVARKSSNTIIDKLAIPEARHKVPTRKQFSGIEQQKQAEGGETRTGSDINDLLRPGEALLMDRFAMDVTAASGNDALYTEFQRLTRAFVGKLLEARRGSD